MRIAIVGSGVSGMAAAWLLSRDHEVDVYEAEPRLGGHAHTVDVEVDGRTIPVDVGFMVFNHTTYPNLIRMFAANDVVEQDADMSFSVRCDADDFEWKGGDLSAFFAQRRNLLSPGHWQLMYDMVRLDRMADSLVDDPELSHLTLGELLDREGFGPAFRERYILPMVSAIWSAPPGKMLDFPAATFVRFFNNHRMLRIRDLIDTSVGTAWKSVRGGSRTYVEALAAQVSGKVHMAAPVSEVSRVDGGVVVTAEGLEPARYDGVVMATHGARTLDLIGQPTELEREILGAFPYQDNRVVLHTDATFLPQTERAHAAWNYYAPACRLDTDGLSVTYYLNKLQQLPVETPVLVTVNPPREPAAGTILAEWNMDHPLFDDGAIAAQSRIPEIQGIDRIWYAGAWQRFGFHEDGFWSGVRVARDGFGVRTPWSDELDADDARVREPLTVPHGAPAPAPEGA